MKSLKIQNKMINLKLFKQTHGYCGPTALRMVLDYYGLEKTEEELARLVGATKEEGCDPWQIASAAKKLGFQAHYIKNSSINEIKRLLAEGIPPIVDWNPKPNHGHYSVVVGIEKDRIIIADSGRGYTFSMDLEEFQKKWYENYKNKKVEAELIVVEKSRDKFRKAVFVPVYKLDEHDQPLYLILRRKLHWKGWEFTKGGIELGEGEIEAARREAHEESGLRVLDIRKFNFRGKYKYRRIFKDRPNYIGQEYILFAARVGEGKVRYDSREHDSYSWLKFGEAIKRLRWDNQKKCLKIVNEWIVKK